MGVVKELGKCCDDMESAISNKFLAIKNGEIVLTGEMSLSYCPFCSNRIRNPIKTMYDDLNSDLGEEI